MSKGFTGTLVRDKLEVGLGVQSVIRAVSGVSPLSTSGPKHVSLQLSHTSLMVVGPWVEGRASIDRGLRCLSVINKFIKSFIRRW